MKYAYLLKCMQNKFSLWCAGREKLVYENQRVVTTGTNNSQYSHVNKYHCVLLFHCSRTVQRWQDIQLRWDPAVHGDIRVIRVRPRNIWRPDIVFFNKCANVQVHINVQYCTRMHTNYSTSTTLGLSEQFSTLLNYCTVQYKY